MRSLPRYVPHFDLKWVNMGRTRGVGRDRALMAEIRALPPEVAAQIKSSVQITTLASVVLGLFKNCLDASASKVEISIDFARASCSVEDDGSGIAPQDFSDDGGLGRPYHTSRLEEDVARHGAHGIFLASASAMSILTIVSRHRSHETTNALIFHHSHPVARLIPAPTHLQLKNHGHGTRVLVQDLFGNMPVRVRQRPSNDDPARARERDWTGLCKSLVGILLAWSQPVSVTMTCSNSDQGFRIKFSSLSIQASTKSFDVTQKCLVLSQGLGIEPEILSRWVKASARALGVTIRGLISLEPAPTKSNQFLCIGVHYIDAENTKSPLYEEINRMFAASSFGCVEDLNNGDFEEAGPGKDRRYRKDGITQRQLRGRGKGIDQWPVYFIRIDLDGTSEDQRRHVEHPESPQSLSPILEVLRTMIQGFLSQHHFRPHQRGRVDRSLRASSRGMCRHENLASHLFSFMTFRR